MLKLIVMTLVFFSSFAFGQFKEDLNKKINVHDNLFNNSPSNFLLDFLSSDNFRMNHTMSMSYGISGADGMALGVYTNSMFFKFSDALTLNVDASIVNTPYNTYGDSFTKSVNGIYLSSARLNYKISEKTNITFEYRQIPAGMNYYGGYDRYNRYNRNNFYDRFMFSE
jgi:hypothetical protein